MNNLIPRAKGGHFALDMVLEQLHYWGRNTDDSLKLTAAEVIEALVKMIDERCEATQIPYVDRGDAVNLARNWLDKEAGGWSMTTEGIRILADAVMAMDKAICGISPQEGK